MVMKSKNPFTPQLYLFTVSVILTLAFSAFAQSDPNPNSPIPVLISQNDSNRALAFSAGRTVGGKTRH